VLKLTGQVAAKLNQPAVRERRLFDAAADAITRLEYDHVAPSQGEITGGAEAGKPGSQDDYIVAHHITPLKIGAVGHGGRLTEPSDHKFAPPCKLEAGVGLADAVN
jgi:hypothetical protein